MNEDIFDLYFRKADLDGDGKISGAEAVAFLQMSNLPKHVLAQVWMHADQKQVGFLGRTEFFNALKLVTVAQSKRELTPDIVRKALYGPAASQIPAPQINLPSLSSQMNLGATATPAHLGGSNVKTTENTSHQSSTFQNQLSRPPGGMLTTTASQPQFGVTTQNFGSGDSVASLHPRTSSTSMDGYNGVGIHGLANSQIPNSMSTSRAVSGMTLSGFTPVRPNVFASSGLATSVRGILQDSTTTLQVPKQNGPAPALPMVSLPASSSVIPLSSEVHGIQHNMQHGHHKNSSSNQKLLDNQLFQAPLTTKHSQAFAQQTTSVASVGLPSSGAHSSTSESQYSWPKINQSDFQKYTKVFVEVDKDRDGKITGEQAHKLFLSWRLPREILKQVWDLSDQDNDGMLSLKEFCVALYFMERYREGRSLPTTLPNGIMFDDTTIQKAVQPAVGHGNFPSAPSMEPDAKKRSYGEISGFPSDTTSISDHKKKHNIPMLEKHLLNQLSKEEQSSLESKFEEATDADKKVEELEKEILDSREKIEFYRTKMQELILYKSRCDNRMNEIIERMSSEKSEVDLLSKKYEAKCKQVGDVASKLTMEEATFRDIQERKMELYQAIAKMEKGGYTSGSLQEHTERIRSDLEGLVKALNERSKRYGLRVRPTTLLELPFGWQPALPEGAADWDENWDKFEDEGFIFVKEFTLDVQNVIAPPKIKFSIQEGTSIEEGSSATSLIVDNNPDRLIPETENESVNTAYKNDSHNSIESPDRSVGYSHEFHDLESVRIGSEDGSSHMEAGKSDPGVLEPVKLGEKNTEDSEWGVFDRQYDADSTWGFKDAGAKGSDGSAFEDSFIHSSEFALNPIRTSSHNPEGVSVQKKSPFNIPESIPSTPVFDSGNSPAAQSEASAEEHSFGSFPRFDSFSVQESGFFPPHDSFARFDSIRSSADSDHGHGFGSFDDPFGSSGPFKPTSESTPKSGSINWSAF